MCYVTCYTNGKKEPRLGGRRNCEINPMDQRLKTRIQNLQSAPRCGARTRAGTPCQRPALRGRKRCRLKQNLGSTPWTHGPEEDHLPAPTGALPHARRSARRRRSGALSMVSFIVARASDSKARRAEQRGALAGEAARIVAEKPPSAVHHEASTDAPRP